MSLGICFKKLHFVKVDAFAWYCIKIRIIFGIWFERRKVDKKSKPTRKLKHANSILEYFEYFCQISSISIIIISSYTISKFTRFLRHSVDITGRVLYCFCATKCTLKKSVINMLQVSSVNCLNAFYIILISAYDVYCYSFDGRVVAKLPFVPISWLQNISHRNLLGDDYTECSFIFLYILCTMSIRQVSGSTDS